LNRSIGITDMHGHRNPQPAARIPHRIKPRIVHAHEFSRGTAITQIQTKGLEDFHTDRARGFGLANFVGLPGRVAGLARAGPRRFGHGNETVWKRAIEVPDGGRELLTRPAGQVDHCVKVDGVHRLDELRGWDACALRRSPRHVAVEVDHGEPGTRHLSLLHVQHAFRLELRQPKRQPLACWRLLGGVRVAVGRRMNAGDRGAEHRCAGR
jgi:hypothetical protein